MGFDPKDRTIGKEFIGQIGSNKYRRVFGELEITGFKVAFGKNQVNDPGLLEALCKQAAGKLIVKGTNLLTQCDKYRKDQRNLLQLLRLRLLLHQPRYQLRFLQLRLYLLLLHL